MIESAYIRWMLEPFPADWIRRYYDFSFRDDEEIDDSDPIDPISPITPTRRIK